MAKPNRYATPIWLFHIVTSALFDLATPILLGFFLARLFVNRCGAGEWLYAVLIVFGALVGFFSMIRFILSATAALERLEKQRKENEDGRESQHPL